MEKKSVWNDYAAITVGVIIVSIAVYFFMIPGKVVVGSVTGLSMVLVHFIPVSISVMTFILNAICLVMGFLLIGKEFGAKTIYASMLMPVILFIFESMFPGMESLTDNVILDALSFIVIVSVGQVLLFNRNASSGGLDIIAKIMNKYFHIELGMAVTIAGMVTVLSSAFVYDTATLVVGALGTYFNGLVVDEYISGFSRKKRVCIISEDYEEIQEYIMHDLNRGVTLYTATGGYDNKSRTELVTILNKNEYVLLMKHIRESDEKAFVTVSTISEVVGMWNTAGRRRMMG